MAELQLLPVVAAPVKEDCFCPCCPSHRLFAIIGVHHGVAQESRWITMGKGLSRCNDREDCCAAFVVEIDLFTHAAFELLAFWLVHGFRHGMMRHTNVTFTSNPGSPRRMRLYMVSRTHDQGKST
mmetsp:Transcript_24501/g.50971  ORF Transcript_24501/g.50971 Transcript_24501/m.50971 type:complete len:125 (+) Transcript_24501:145-519(+)